MIKALLMDFDGVIAQTESYRLHYNYDLLRSLNVSVELKDLIKLAGTTYELREELTYEMYKNHKDFDKIREIVLTRKYWVYPIAELMSPHVHELFDYCHKNKIKIAICSNSSEERLKDVIHQAHIEKEIDLIIPAKEFHRIKPDPFIYTYAMSKLNLNPDECIVVEDSVLGIEAGIASGCRTIALRDKDHLIDQSKADHIIDDLIEMIDIMEREPIQLISRKH